MVVPLFNKNTLFSRKFKLLLLTHFLTNHLENFGQSYCTYKETSHQFLCHFAIIKTAKLAPKKRHFRPNQEKHIVYAGKLTYLALALRALRALGLALLLDPRALRALAAVILALGPFGPSDHCRGELASSLIYIYRRFFRVFH